MAVIIPDEDVLKAWAASNSLGGKTFAELCKMDEVKQHMLKTIQAHGKAHDLKGFENIKNLYLDNELFSVENNLLVSPFANMNLFSPEL